MELFQNEARDFVCEALAKADISAEVSVAMSTDVPRTIVEASKDYDLIVMGASNEWTLRQRLFGSIPDQVANQAAVSVLMVRSKDR